jgi:hypothetical protein
MKQISQLPVFSIAIIMHPAFEVTHGETRLLLTRRVCAGNLAAATIFQN